MKKYIFNSLRKKRDINMLIEKRLNIILIFIIILFATIFIAIYNVQVLKHDYYSEKAEELSKTVIEGPSAPRGRIYDRNYNLLVDNKAVKTIYYKKPDNITVEKEIKFAYDISKILEVDYSKLYLRNIKEFLVAKFSDTYKEKITEDEWEKLKHRKLTLDDIYDLKLERVTEEEINAMTDIDKEATYIYYLMNNGYSYDKKIIKNDNVTDYEYAVVSENMSKYKGFTAGLDWERVYLYDNIFKSVFGKVSDNNQGIPAELKEHYLDLGYKLNDRVGISYLEFQYESYLKGIKPKYKVDSENNYELITEGKRGNDIVLTIDIRLQEYLEKTLEEEMRITKTERNTEYYNKTFVVITEPSTGEILAMSGKQILQGGEGYKVVDYTPGIWTSSVTAGSIVKGASMTVGYREGAIDIGTEFYDSCIKIKSTPEKCSWKRLGRVDDLEALKRSSNVYQFLTAIKVGGGTYIRNGSLTINPLAFQTYRNGFAEYGLGLKTGIDMPNESLGYKGSSTLAGHLLDFSIGQYDTYTPIEISQYINTIANSGNRVKPQLLKEVYTPTGLEELIYSYKPEILNKVSLDEIYINRIRDGFKAVMNPGGTGYGYISTAYDPAGKTGTAESFADTNGDGKIDTETVTKNFIAYAPADSPKMSIVVNSPDLRHTGNNSTYTSGINKRITIKLTNFFFSLE